MRIGYLVPEFPAQTHAFFWREITALREAGLTPILYSTRMPNRRLISHSWAEEAIRETEYLAPLGLSGCSAVLAEFSRAGPGRCTRAISAVLGQKGLSAMDRLRMLSLVPYAARLSRSARLNEWRHLHVGSCGRSAQIAWLASLLSGTTYSLSMLGPRFDTYGPTIGPVWAHASFALFQSALLLEEGRDRLGADFPACSSVAPVGVDTSFMKRSVPYAPWAPGTLCRVYSCGRLNPIKGHDFVIRAVQLLTREGVEVELTIAGEDEMGGRGYRRQIEELISELGLAGVVRLVGSVSEAESREFLSNAHIYVMGSLDEAAGAVAAMEAMSMEVPVVMTHVGSTPDLIESGREGVLVEPENPDAISRAILTLLGEPARCVEIGRRAREKVDAVYSHHVSAREIVRSLAGIADAPSTAAKA